jgi:hypothetical protein
VSDDDQYSLSGGHWNVVRRIERWSLEAARDALACLTVDVPNEEHLLAAVHLGTGGLHVTLNFDEGIERAYDLLAGTAQLPPSAVQYRRPLEQWRRLFPARAPALNVLVRPEAHDWAALGQRPLLVKVRGSAGPARHVSMGHTAGANPDDPYPPESLAPLLDAATSEALLVVTGYSGNDPDVFPALLGRLRASRFEWSALEIKPSVARALRRIDVQQPRTQAASAALRSVIFRRTPSWPRVPSGGRFSDRLENWRRAHVHAAARTFAGMLYDAGRHKGATSMFRQISAHAGIAGSTAWFQGVPA